MKKVTINEDINEIFNDAPLTNDEYTPSLAEYIEAISEYRIRIPKKETHEQFQAEMEISNELPNFFEEERSLKQQARQSTALTKAELAIKERMSPSTRPSYSITPETLAPIPKRCKRKD